MDTKNLEERILRLESLEEIRKLKSLYCAYCDDSYNPVNLASLFTDDAVWEASHRGRMEGKKAIHDFFKNISGKITFAAHLVMNEIIEVDGNMASGQWRMMMASVERFEGVDLAVWGLGNYDQDYVRNPSNGKWLIKRSTVVIDFLNPATHLWERRI